MSAEVLNHLADDPNRALFTDAHRFLTEAGWPATADCIVAAYALAVRQRDAVLEGTRDE